MQGGTRLEGTKHTHKKSEGLKEPKNLQKKRSEKNAGIRTEGQRDKGTEEA